MKQNLPGGRSAVVPPDPMPNSEVKRRSADGSVGSPHARVGNCQFLLPFDLHVLGLPPAFNLSHDQTLQFKSLMLKELNFVMNYDQVTCGFRDSDIQPVRSRSRRHTRFATLRPSGS